MNFPEGWTLTHTPTDDDQNLRILKRDGAAVAGITFRTLGQAGGGTVTGQWRWFPLSTDGPAKDGMGGFQTIDTAAFFAMRELWPSAAESADDSEMDDYEYDQQARAERARL